MRLSKPRASARVTTSAPEASHSSAITLANVIFVARNALAALLISSAVGRSVTRTGMSVDDEGVVHEKEEPSGFQRRDTEHDALRGEGVPHRVALAQELGVPGNLDAHARRSPALDQPVEPVGSAHRHRGLADDEARSSQVREERQDGRLDVAGVGTQSVRQLRCTHADEVHVRPLGQLGAGRGEPEPAGRTVPAHQTLELGLEERHGARGERARSWRHPRRTRSPRGRARPCMLRASRRDTPCRRR